ncbi:MAG TPA: hypothetical protein DEP66_00520, partial [Acidimicrobiaceae bacterium]|nr:hypothetical protein [Acidimicrobiaceae bacterium]
MVPAGRGRRRTKRGNAAGGAGAGGAADRAGARAHSRLLSTVRWELIPLKNFAEQCAFLPPGSTVTVTASPNKTLEDTLDLCEQLGAAGHKPVPHVAARMVRSRGHLAELAARIAALGMDEIFLVGGDQPEPAGAYAAAVELLEDLLTHVAAGAPVLTRIGVPSYPDGHALIADDDLRGALLRKQELLAAAGIASHAATQMCFDAAKIVAWLRAERAAGLRLPVLIGI